MEAVTKVDLPIRKFRSGKVREVFDLDDALLMVATDRVSAFDVVLPNGIPDKGKVLNQLSVYWFGQFDEIIPNHVITADDNEVADRLGSAYDDSLRGRSVIVRKCDPVLIESVARSYLAGSLYKEYLAAGGADHAVRLHGIDIPGGIQLCGLLPAPIFNPATKAQEGHDENISFEEASEIAGEEIASECKRATLAIFEKATAICDRADIILADTKFEFGMVDDRLILIDEVLTPDSSRFWPRQSYAPGKNQDSLDKQYIRDYLETLDWNKTAPGPHLPDAAVKETRARYIDIFERITGTQPQL
ncbi:MAG: phosphoribosylaminoimidazolesuccinocarboxamide synthase [Fimbriimonadales bacterium]